MAIHKRLYRRIDPPPAREGAGRFPALAIGHYGSRYAIRGWFPRLLFYASFVPAVGYTLAIHFASQKEESTLALASQFLGRSFSSISEIDVDTWRQLAGLLFFSLLGFQAWFVLMLNAFVGSRLIADDLKSHALEIYLTRPIRAADYVLGKLAVVMRPILIMTWAPCLVVFAVAWALLPGAGVAAWPVLLRALGAGVVLAGLNGIVILGISATTTSARYASVIWFVLYFLTMIIHGILSRAAGGSGVPFELISYRANQEIVVQHILGAELPAIDPELAYLDAPLLPSLAVLSILALLMLGLVARRLRPGRFA